jgi:hypothetical protein
VDDLGHLQDINQTYWVHFRRAVRLALRFALAAPLLLIHAVLPNLFTKAGTRAVETYHQLMADQD